MVFTHLMVEQWQLTYQANTKPNTPSVPRSTIAPWLPAETTEIEQPEPMVSEGQQITMSKMVDDAFLEQFE